MKERKILRLLLLLAIILFLMFCYIDWSGSIILFLVLILGLVLIKVFEIISFLRHKKKLLKIGRIELFEKKILQALKGLTFLFVLYIFIKKAHLITFKINDFTTFFLDNTRESMKYYIIMSLIILREVIDDDRMFYATDRGLVTYGNYFESYFWDDFLDFKIIKEQSLILFKKNKGEFLFITYDDSFQGKEELIIESLSKNLTEDV